MIFIDEDGREKPRKEGRCAAMQKSGEAEFLGRRGGVAVYRAGVGRVHFWNGSCCGGGGRCRHMHRPGEVVS